MSVTFILIVVMIITILLGRYALAEGQRIESQKKFVKNMKDFDNKKENKMKKIKKRTLNELRQVKTYGYRPPSPSKEKDKKDSKNDRK